MAERRMFAKTIIDSDAFLEMPLSAQALYFHLGMRGDDEGFINNPRRIQKTLGCGDDEMKLLFAKNFVIPFESGVIVIKHWKIHNYIRGDRLKETVYQDERSLLTIKENDAYTLSIIDKHSLPQLTAKEKRHKAYEDSELPYSFEYKIRHAFTGKKCPICGSTMGLSDMGCKTTIPTIQHNIPLSKGGKHELGNISVICRSCNVSIQDNETGELNANEVAITWNEICGIDEEIKNDCQMSDDCQSSGSIGKVRLGKVSLDQVSVGNSDTTPTTDNSLQEIGLKQVINCFENNIHPIVQIEFETLSDYRNDFDDEVIIMAIEEAVTAGARNMKYLKGILNNWNTLGLHTKKEVEAHQRDWIDKKNQKTKTRDKPKEPLAIPPNPSCQKCEGRGWVVEKTIDRVSGNERDTAVKCDCCKEAS